MAEKQVRDGGNAPKSSVPKSSVPKSIGKKPLLRKSSRDVLVSEIETRGQK